MISLKYFILLGIIVFLTTLITLGCGSQGTTTIFKWTPVDTMPDGLTNPDRLTKELEEQLEREDEKRIKILQEKAKENKEKEVKPAEKKEEEAKSVESGEVK